MKANWKIALMAAGGMFALGVILCLTALARVDFDFWRLSSDYEEGLPVETAQYDPAKVSEIVVDINVDGLRIESSEDGQIHVQYTQRRRRPYTLTQRNGVLRITQEQKGWHWFSFDMGWNSAETAMILSLPQPFRGDLTLRSSTGDIRAGTLHLTGGLDCTSDTGSVELSGLKAASARVEVDTGSIRGEDWAVDGGISVESDTGAVSAIRWQAGGALDVDSDTGAVRLEDCAAEGPLQCSNSTGAIRLIRVAAPSVYVDSSTGAVTLDALCAPLIEIESNTGAVRGTIEGAERDYTIEAESDVGDCNLRTRAGLTEKMLRVESDVGDIDLTFTQE